MMCVGPRRSSNTRSEIRGGMRSKGSSPCLRCPERNACLPIAPMFPIRFFPRRSAFPEASIKRLVHQLRRRYRELLREEVAETIENPSDVDDELRYLCAALAAGQA